MVRLVISRLALSLVTLLVISVVVFWAVVALPGDAATRILGRQATAEDLRILREKLGLDQPTGIRYLKWLNRMVRGDLGESLIAGREVLGYVRPRLKNTLILAGLALVVYAPLSLFLGALTAIRRGSAVDASISVLTLVAMSLPEFVLGVMLMWALAVNLRWLPPLSLIDQAKSATDWLRALTLPTLTLVAGMTAYAVRMMRENLIQVLESDYVRMATIKGLSRREVLLRHALPNALGPALNVTALNAAWLIGGVMVVETVFNFPGLGRLLISSISFRDSPVIQFIVMVLAAVYVLLNMLADVSALALNPRLRER